MQETYAITLPFPQSTNALYATVRGRRVLSAKGRAYKHMVFECFHAARAVFVAGLVWVVVHAIAPDKRRRDLDNLLKLTQDSLTGLAWTDDSQIQDVRVRWAGPPCAPGHIVVEYGPWG